MMVVVLKGMKKYIYAYYLCNLYIFFIRILQMIHVEGLDAVQKILIKHSSTT